MKKIFASSVGIFLFFISFAQENVANISNDTVITSFLWRNNLEAQKIASKTANGTIYILNQDNIPCFAPDKEKETSMPNAFSGSIGNVERMAVPYYFDENYLLLKALNQVKEEKQLFYKPKKLEFNPLQQAK